MSSYNYHQPPPYISQPQSGYTGSTAPSSSSTNPLLPQYHQHRHQYHPHRNRQSNTASDGVTIRLFVPATATVDRSVADAKALDRFWSAMFLGILIWLAVIIFTDGVEMMRMAAIGFVAALKAMLDHILEHLRESGWAV